jgi:hypothetical protein
MYREAATSTPPRPQPTLFRFGLRNMLLVVGALCVLFASMSAVGGMLSLAILLLALVVTAHVLSTFVGTRLRDGSTAASQWEAANGVREQEPYLAVDSLRRVIHPHEAERSQHLQGRGLSVWWIIWVVAVGGVAAAGVCTAVMIELLWPRIGVPAIVAGAVAAGVLAAWTVFLGLSFYLTSRRAWQEALDGAVSRPDPRRQTAAASTVPNQA